MGKQDGQQELFAYNVNLDERIRQTNPLRKIKRVVDFSFVREHVQDCYGYNGNESVDPAVIIKMLFLLFFDNVESERELMKIISERLDYMWFLGYGLNDVIPNHSVLSKARNRWGKEVFEELFIRVVWQCVQAGLVGGDKVHLDGSLIDANASKNLVKKCSPEIIAEFKKLYQGEENKLSEPLSVKDETADKKNYYEKVNDKLVSTTDPDAAVVRKGSLESRPRYKNHRVVDDTCGVITAVETTPGDIEENKKAFELVEQHEKNTETKVETMIADTQYGTVENMITCFHRNVRCHMGDMGQAQQDSSSRKGIFGEDKFSYDTATDTYSCPAGNKLRKRKHKKSRCAYEYVASKAECKNCQLRAKCTRAANGGPRTLKRHYDHDALLISRNQSASKEAKSDRVRRKWLMEGNFADAANNHGFKRSRWRRLKNQQIQDYLIAAIQNVRILIKKKNGLTPCLENRISWELNALNVLPLYNNRDINTQTGKLSLLFPGYIPSLN